MRGLSIDTIDGHDTFDAMGGIQCFTLKKSLENPSIPPVTSLSECGTIPLEHFDKPCDSGFASLIIEPAPGIARKQVLPKLINLLWMFGKWKNVAKLAGWNGFMEKTTAEKEYQTSSILWLLFIKAPLLMLILYLQIIQPSKQQWRKVLIKSTVL